VGSLFRNYEIDPGGRVIVETIPESMKGMAQGYSSKALGEKRTASGSKTEMARFGNRVDVDERQNFDIVDVVNPLGKSRGEIISLLVNFNEEIAVEQREDIFRDKLRVVIGLIRADRISDAEVSDKEIIAFMTGLSVRDLYMLSVHKLENLFLTSRKAAPGN
jgi:hypothetical protein